MSTQPNVGEQLPMNGLNPIQTNSNALLMLTEQLAPDATQEMNLQLSCLNKTTSLALRHNTGKKKNTKKEKR